MSNLFSRDVGSINEIFEMLETNHDFIIQTIKRNAFYQNAHKKWKDMFVVDLRINENVLNLKDIQLNVPHIKKDLRLKTGFLNV